MRVPGLGTTRPNRTGSGVLHELYPDRYNSSRFSLEPREEGSHNAQIPRVHWESAKCRRESVKCIVTKTEDLNSMPGAHMVEEENQHRLC